MPKALFLSYYFPPCGAGWVMRTVNFIRHLPKWGWETAVLTVEPEYYKENAAPDKTLLEGLPENLLVVRTRSLEPKMKLRAENTKMAAHLEENRPSLFTRFLNWIEKAVFFPDVKILWLPYALWQGRKIIHSQKSDLIYVSVPDFSLLIIAYYLSRLTKKPMVIDFRDDWDENPFYYHKYAYGRKLITYWERKAVAAADRVILVTERSKAGFERRHPEHAAKFVLLPNGYDPKIDEITASVNPLSLGDVGSYLPTSPRQLCCQEETPDSTIAEFTILHSGSLPPERVTPALFEALSELLDENPAWRDKIKLIFAGNACSFAHKLVERLNLGQNVQFAGNLPYEENIRQMAQASLLLLIPSLNIPNSLPGKLYEYLAVKRPFLALAEDNVTRDFLQAAGYKHMAHPDDKREIKEALAYFYNQHSNGSLGNWQPFMGIENYNRARQTGQLAEIFNSVLN